MRTFKYQIWCNLYSEDIDTCIQCNSETFVNDIECILIIKLDDKIQPRTATAWTQNNEERETESSRNHKSRNKNKWKHKAQNIFTTIKVKTCINFIIRTDMVDFIVTLVMDNQQGNDNIEHKVFDDTW